MVQTCQQMIDVGESLGWGINDISEACTSNLGFELCQYSPAGEDFFFCAQADDVRGIVQDIVEYARYFDVDEHVKAVMNMRGAPSLHVLIDDADDIAEMIQKLADALIDFEEEDNGTEQS